MKPTHLQRYREMYRESDCPSLKFEEFIADTGSKNIPEELLNRELIVNCI